MTDELSPQVETQTDTPTEPPAPTWDNPPPETPPEPAQEAATPAPPSETTDAAPQPEQETQPPAETAPARESQPEADAYVAEADDPPEITALTTPAAKRWAKRQYTEAYPTRVFLDPQKPIQTFGDDLYERSPTRYWEHVDDVFKNHQDYFVQKVNELNKSTEQPAPASPSTTAPTTPTTLTEAELANLSDAQIVERFQQAQTAAAAQVREELQKDFDAKFNDLKTQFDAVNGRFTTSEQQAREQQVVALESELKTSVMKVVEDAARESGLEPKPDDPAELANLKRAALTIVKTQFEPTFDADEDNVKVVEKVREFAKRLERANVFREEDNLKIRARAAFEKVKQSPELKAIMDQIVKYVDQSKAKPRADNPAPPVPGAAAGVTIQPPSSWDEAYQQAKTQEASA